MHILPQQAVTFEVTEPVMLTSEQLNMNILCGWLIILAQSAVCLGIFFRLIVLTSNHSHWYTIHDHDSSWQSLHNFVQFFQLGLVSFFLLIPEADLDRLTLRWMFLSLKFLLVAGQMAENNSDGNQKSLTLSEILNGLLNRKWLHLRPSYVPGATDRRTEHLRTKAAVQTKKKREAWERSLGSTT